MVCWDLKWLKQFPHGEAGKSRHCVCQVRELSSFDRIYGCFNVCSCCTWIIEVDGLNAWSFRSCALSPGGFWPSSCGGGHSNQKNLEYESFPFSLPQRKKKIPDEFLHVQPILKRDSSLMDRVSWCKSGITRSGNMITQRMIEGIIPEVLSLVVQLA